MNTIFKILVINPGSTSTKIAVFDNDREVMSTTLRHSSEELAPYKRVADQFTFRKSLIVDALAQAGIPLDALSAVIGRGGLVKPIPSGVYEVNEALKRDLLTPPMGEHASNLGGLLAADIAAMIPGAKAFIADPVVVDELEEVARVTGSPLIQRVSIFHALNQKAVARAYARSVGRSYEQMNLIVAHMGGGISVGAHRKGKVIDVTNALNGEGAFSPERSGALPAKELVKLCFGGQYSETEVLKMVSGRGGLVALTGSNNVKELVDRAQAGDAATRLIVEAMAYNVGKNIGEMATVLHGEVDAVILTGGIAYSSFICDYIRRMVAFIAPVQISAGEDEMQALAENALDVLRGERGVQQYQ